MPIGPSAGRSTSAIATSWYFKANSLWGSQSYMSYHSDTYIRKKWCRLLNYESNYFASPGIILIETNLCRIFKQWMSRLSHLGIKFIISLFSFLEQHSHLLNDTLQDLYSLICLCTCTLNSRLLLQLKVALLRLCLLPPLGPNILNLSALCD